MNNEIIISICIPTYNRSSFLEKTLDSIVSETIYGENKIEIVISDNNSSDDTGAVVKKYSELYNNIIYHKNDENTGFMNIKTVLDHASGQLLKVHNDYTLFNKGSLKKLLILIENQIEFKPHLFFGNGLLKRKTSGTFNNFNDFLRSISYWCTFAGGFCIWKTDYFLLKNISVDKMFPHTSLILALTDKERYLINNDYLFENQSINSKGGYNLFNVFAVQFMTILDKCKMDGDITIRTFKTIKRNMMLNFLIPWYFSTKIRKNEFTFELDNLKGNICTFYSSFEYHFMLILAHLYIVKIIVNKVFSTLKN